jgi:hypothetical protein
MVIGTTGFSEAEKGQIKAASRDTAVVHRGHRGTSPPQGGCALGYGFAYGRGGGRCAGPQS